MSQKELEIILARQLASYLAMPIFIVDPHGTLIYYNESAEKILGLRFEQTGEMALESWARAFSPMASEGGRLDEQQLPLVIALRDRRPAHSRFGIIGADNVRREIEVTAFPINGQAERFLGAVAIFWEVRE